MTEPSGRPDAEAGEWLRELARVVALQQVLADDTQAALRLFDAADRLLPSSTWDMVHQRVYAQVMWLCGETDRLRDALPQLANLEPEDLAFLETDLLGAAHGTGSEPWLAALNHQLARFGVAPVWLRNAAAEGAAFDRLAAQVDEIAPPGRGPLVSVVMSAYRPGREIYAAVRSVLEQTWRDVELIVVDDASGAEFDAVFDQVRAMDQRVHVLHQATNRGTYAARNVGLEAARGKFVTFQDSDDWSHPERVARQVAPLVDDPEVHSTLSRSVRCSPDLVFQRLGYATSRTNASSLMFRREQAVASVGYFDHVRKGADVEYAERLVAALPGHQVRLDAQLAFVRMTEGSLSRSDFLSGWQHPVRTSYREGFRAWHATFDDGASPRLDRLPETRAFPASRAMSPDPAPDEEPFDFVFVGDWRRSGAAQEAAVERIRNLAGRGLRVGLASIEIVGVAKAGRGRTFSAAQELITDGTVERVLLDEGRRARLVVVEDPRTLEFPPSLPTRISVDQLVIEADLSPVDQDAQDHRYAVDDCDRNAQLLFGVEPRWASRSERIRRALEPQVTGARLVDLGRMMEVATSRPGDSHRPRSVDPGDGRGLLDRVRAKLARRRKG
ncbi:glycosyltransferase family 2 protein [Isoptericola rhizosphaerae]|uniref:glycosyltransferase family 2 protein n=1 Tax=Isoptericola rhizosphaerae TaxID=3377837 RepID=UPI003839F662